MLNRKRLIPVLSIDNGKLVKTQRFTNSKYLGDPINALKLFNDKMVDEIVILDITASKQGREPDYDLIYEMAGECFSPLGYGGAIKTVEQARKILALGVEKVIINSEAVERPEFISELAEAFGSQSIVVSIDAKKKLLGKHVITSHSASKKGKLTPVEFAVLAEKQGAGEIIIHDTDRDGTFKGLNRTLTSEIAKAVKIPVIACGGSSDVQDMEQTMDECGIKAAAAGSVFVFKGQNRDSILINYPTPKDLL